jgi:hypothetical protein
MDSCHAGCKGIWEGRACMHMHDRGNCLNKLGSGGV